MSVVMAGGGTGGHVYVLLEVANTLKAYRESLNIYLFTDQRGFNLISSQGSYRDLFSRIWKLKLHGLRRRNWLRNLDLPFLLSYAYIKSTFAINVTVSGHISVIFGSGGYVQVPVILAGRRYPLVLYEPNRIPGLSTKLFVRKAEKVCVFMPCEGIPEDKQVITGVPVRKQIFEQLRISREEACAHFDLDSRKPVLLITGGSLGSKFFNEFVVRYCEKLLDKDIQIIWQTGRAVADKGLMADIKQRYGSSVYATPYITDMGIAWKAATVAVTRGGATTIAEILCAGCPSIVVPSPHVADNHQEANAAYFAEKGAIIMSKEQDGYEVLFEKVTWLINSNETRTALADRARKLAIMDASDRIAKLLTGWL